MPVMFDPRSGLPVLILGSEDRRTLLGRAYYEWDGFGGKVELDETVEAAAAREFLEESMSVIPLKNTPRNATAEDIAHALSQRQYLGRVDLSYVRKLQPLVRFTVYSVFFVEAEWDTDLPQRFDALRQDLLNARSVFRRMRPPPVFHDDNMSRFPVDGDPLPHADDIRVHHVQDAWVVLRDCESCGLPDCTGCLHRHPACLRRAAAPAALLAKLAVADGRTGVFHTVVQPEPRPVRAYVSWVATNKAARAELDAMDTLVRSHAAIVEQAVQGVYLEKRRMRYMSAAQALSHQPSGRGSLLPARVSSTVSARLQVALRAWLRVDPLETPVVPATPANTLRGIGASSWR